MTSTTKADEFMADLRRAYRDEYEASAELKAEFLSAADYAAFKVAENPAMVGKMCDSVEAAAGESALRRAGHSTSNDRGNRHWQDRRF